MTQSVFTYSDAVDHLLDFGQASRNSIQHRHARRAVESAVSRLTAMHDWSCLQRYVQIQTSAPVTGTATVSVVDGEYLLTLASGSWPEWAEVGRVRINSVLCEVVSRDSDTVLTLNGGEPPTGSVSYSLVRDRYLLPENLSQIEEIRTGQDMQYELLPAPPGHETAEYHRANRPTGYSVQDAGEYYGRHMLVLSPAPSLSEPVLIKYTAEIRPPRLEYWTGQGAIVGSTDELVIAQGSFPESVVGAIVRITDSDSPTGAYGRGYDTRDTNVEPTAERTIIARIDAQTVALDAVVPDAVSGPVVVSDPIDIDRGAMMTAFWRLAEEEYLTMTGAAINKLQLMQQRSLQAVREAMASDQKIAIRNTRGAWVINQHPFYDDPLPR